MTPTPWDPEVEFRIERSAVPISEDGYKLGEPKFLICAACGASVQLTPDPSAGVDDFPHTPHCPQRFARSEWWREKFKHTT